MSKTCTGCGAVLQVKYPRLEGFVKENVYDKSTLCERCFKIKNYGEYDVIDLKIDFINMIKELEKSKTGIIYVIDILTLENENKDYLKLLKSDDVVLLTKKDLLPKSVKDRKIIKYFKDNFRSDIEIMVISSEKKYNIDNLVKFLEKSKYNEFNVVGLTNSGKSSLINALVRSCGLDSNITVSKAPNTTTEFIKIIVNPKLTIIDTPGFINKNSIYSLVSLKDIKHIAPKKMIKPKVMQTKPGFTVLVNNILRIDNVGDKNINLVFYMNSEFKFSKIKINTRDDLKSLPKKNIKLSGNEDILINGLGFIKVPSQGEVVVYTLDDGIINIRPKMI